MRTDFLRLRSDVNVVFLVITIGKEEAAIIRVIFELTSFKSELFFDLLRFGQSLHVELTLLIEVAFISEHVWSCAEYPTLDAFLVDFTRSLASGTIFASWASVIGPSVTSARSADAFAVVVAEFAVRRYAGVVGSGASAVVSGEARLAAAFAALAVASLGTAAELTFVPVAAEVLAIAKRTGNNLVLIWSFEALAFSANALSFPGANDGVVVFSARSFVIFQICFCC